MFYNFFLFIFNVFLEKFVLTTRKFNLQIYHCTRREHSNLVAHVSQFVVITKPLCHSSLVQKNRKASQIPKLRNPHSFNYLDFFISSFLQFSISSFLHFFVSSILHHLAVLLLLVKINWNVDLHV